MSFDLNYPGGSMPMEDALSITATLLSQATSVGMDDAPALPGDIAAEALRSQLNAGGWPKSASQLVARSVDFGAKLAMMFWSVDKPESMDLARRLLEDLGSQVAEPAHGN